MKASGPVSCLTCSTLTGGPWGGIIAPLDLLLVWSLVLGGRGSLGDDGRLLGRSLWWGCLSVGGGIRTGAGLQSGPDMSSQDDVQTCLLRVSQELWPDKHRQNTQQPEERGLFTLPAFMSSSHSSRHDDD